MNQCCTGNQQCIFRKSYFTTLNCMTFYPLTLKTIPISCISITAQFFFLLYEYPQRQRELWDNVGCRFRCGHDRSAPLFFMNFLIAIIFLKINKYYHVRMVILFRYLDASVKQWWKGHKHLSSVTSRTCHSSLKCYI